MGCYLGYDSLSDHPFTASHDGHLYINNEEVVNIIVPNDITYIRNHIFYYCKGIVSVDMHSGVTSIGNSAFRYCSALKTLIIRRETPPTLGSDVLTGTNANLKIYVPYSSDQSILHAYQAATNWSSYSAKMYELDENGNIPE